MRTAPPLPSLRSPCNRNAIGEGSRHLPRWPGHPFTCRLSVRRFGASSNHLALDIARGARRTIRQTMQPDHGCWVGSPCLRLAHRPLGFAATSAPGRSIGSWPLPLPRSEQAPAYGEVYGSMQLGLPSVSAISRASGSGTCTGQRDVRCACGAS